MAELEQCMSPILARSVIRWSCQRSGLCKAEVTMEDLPALETVLASSMYLGSSKARELIERVRQHLETRGSSTESLPVGLSDTGVPRSASTGAFEDEASQLPEARLCALISDEDDIVATRTAVRLLATGIGFDPLVVVKLGTVVSELSRNLHEYAGGGTIEARSIRDPAQGIEIIATDHGPGIERIDEIMSSGYRSRRGCGLCGCRNLVDELKVQSRLRQGTVVTARKFLKSDDADWAAPPGSR